MPQALPITTDSSSPHGRRGCPPGMEMAPRLHLRPKGFARVNRSRSAEEERDLARIDWLYHRQAAAQRLTDLFVFVLRLGVVTLRRIRRPRSRPRRVQATGDSGDDPDPHAKGPSVGSGAPNLTLGYPRAPGRIDASKGLFRVVSA